MEGKFEGCELKHIGRASNEEAYTLANIGSTCAVILDGVFCEVINQLSIKVKTSAHPTQSATDSGTPPQATDTNTVIGPSQQVLLLEPVWTHPFLAYLLRQELLDDPAEARRIVRRSKAYTV
jgi:hypothetical protein